MAHPTGDHARPGRGRPPLNRARQVIGRHPFGHNARQQVSPPGPGGGGAAVGATPPLATNPYDYSSDPLLQRIRAAGTQRIGEGEAEALRQRKQLLIDYGDADLARSLGMDASTIAAAQNNAFSTRAALAKEQHDQPIALDQNLQGGNLFYSGARGVQQSNLATQLLGRSQAAQQAARGGLSKIDQDLLGIRQQVNDQNLSAEEDAASRLQQQLGELPVGSQGAPIGGGGPFRSAIPRQGLNTNRLARMLRPRGRAMPRGHRGPPAGGRQS